MYIACCALSTRRPTYVKNRRDARTGECTRRDRHTHTHTHTHIRECERETHCVTQYISRSLWKKSPIRYKELLQKRCVFKEACES